MNDKQNQHQTCEERERADPIRGEPILLLAFIENDLQGADSDRKHPNAPGIDFRGRTPDVLRIEDEHLRHNDRNNADGNVHVEHPPPRIIVREPSPQDWPKHRGHDDAQSPKTHRFPALRWGKGFEHHRLRNRLQNAAGESLHDAENNEPCKIRGEAAHEGRGREPDDRRHQQPFPAEVICKPAGDRKHDRVRYKV